jgi:hypothetical protein
MTVGEFQLLLSELGRFLRACKSAAAAKEVEEVGAKLAGFRDYKLKAFGDLLVKAEEYARLGPQAKVPKVPKAPKAGAGKTKADPAALDQALLRLVQLYQQAIDPATTLDAVEAAVKSVQDLDPPKARLDELARKVGLEQKFKKKEDALKAVRQKILSLKGAWDRKDA